MILFMGRIMLAETRKGKRKTVSAAIRRRAALAFQTTAADFCLEPPDPLGLRQTRFDAPDRCDGSKPHKRDQSCQRVRAVPLSGAMAARQDHHHAFPA
jgi:hypothetical protein